MITFDIVILYLLIGLLTLCSILAWARFCTDDTDASTAEVPWIIFVWPFWWGGGFLTLAIGVFLWRAVNEQT